MAKEIWKHTYSTDYFSEDYKKQIKELWKKSPESLITVKGPARQDFIKWLKSEYEDIIEKDDFYTLKAGDNNE